VKNGIVVREVTKSFATANAVVDSNVVSVGYWEITAYVYDKLVPPQLINFSKVSVKHQLLLPLRLLLQHPLQQRKSHLPKLKLL